jgi:RNA polymerase-binding transcription factor DksA
VNAQEARSRLESRLEELDRSAAVLVGEVAEGMEVTDEAQRRMDPDPSDSARQLVDSDREEASIEVIEAQRSRVRQALERLDAGTYGRCVDCGKELPDARLDARPEADRCVECQHKVEARR